MAKGRQLASVTDAADTLSFSYDASGRRMGKKAAGERTKYFYAGDTLIREERCDDNNTQYFGDDLVAGDNSVEGDGIVVDSVNKSVLEYIYGQDGVVGLVYNGAKYYFRHNVQGDITHIYSLDGELAACYTYDAWGNHKVFDAEGKENTDLGFIGNVNPFRYRGYYFDTETGLYYCKSRYYDPEVGRWINADDVAYLDPESINGLNLYAYCGNNPVMYTDSSGCSRFRDIFKWILVGVVTVVAVAAIVVGTVVTGGALGAVLVGSGVGAIVGGGIGGVNAHLNGTDIASGILGGAITGAALGAAAPLASFGGAGFGIMLATTTTAGMLSYTVETLGNGREYNVGNMFISGAFNALQGTLTFGMGSILKMANSNSMIEKLAKSYLSKSLSGQINYVVDILGGIAIGNKPTKSDMWLKYFGIWAS